MESRYYVAGALLFLASCSTPLVKSPNPTSPVPTPPAVVPATPVPNNSSLRRLSADNLPEFIDDGDTESLRAAALQSGAYYQSLPPTQAFTLGVDTFSAHAMADSMETFVELLDSATTREAWREAIRQNFWVYASVGSDHNGTVTFSSYYEPTIEARLSKGGAFQYPLYGRPSDLVDVDLGLFIPAYAGAHISGRRDGDHLVPYYSREDIDSNGELNGQKLEIAWAKDPADIFFLQIEGSGWLDLGNGKRVRIRYAGNNGLPYRSVGLYLIQSGRARSKGFDHKAFVQYLKEHPTERQAVFNVDSRYVFFQIDTSSSQFNTYGNIDVPLTPDRSIATDPKVFPKGALAWIEVHHAPGHQSVDRFMLNQDEGGAIQGAGRVDYFAGNGPKAEKFATHFWYPGKLYFLVKKQS